MRNLMKLTPRGLGSFLVLFVLLVGVASCSSDDNSSSTNESLIVGVWKPVKEGETCSSGYEDFDILSACDQKSRLKFNADGTYKLTDFDDWTGTCVEEETEFGTWVLIGDKISVTSEYYDEEDVDELSVLELSSTTLRLGFYPDMEDMDEFCEDGSSVSYFFMEFARVEQ